MSNKNSNLDLLQSSQQGKELTQNALNNAFSPASLFAKRDKTTALLTWGYYGGNLMIGSTLYSFNPSTILLTDNSTNYIELNHSNATVVVNTTGFATDASKTRLYSVVTSGGQITDWTDYRGFLKIQGSDSYALPTASTTVLGGVKIDGTTITIDANGVITAVAGSYTLPKATTTVLGGVKVDGTTITVDSNGVISGFSYTLPTASTTIKGGVKVDGTTITVDANGVITSVAGSSYTLPTASTVVLGGVKIDGTTITINNGVISSTQYTLPTSSTTVLGGVKVDGSSITIDGNGVISAASGSSILSTNRAFDLKSKSGLVVGLYGGKANNIAGGGFYNSSNNIRTIPDTNITLPANSSGYIVYRNALGGSLTYVLTADVYTATQKPLYYFETGPSTVTKLDDVRHSFVNFDMYAPIKEIVFTSWTTGTVYSSAANFVDLNTSGSTYNLLPRRVMLQCTTAELGYSVGHMVSISAYEPAVVVEQGNIRIITQTTLPQILNRTAGSIGALATVTAANWKIVLIVEPVM